MRIELTRRPPFNGGAAQNLKVSLLGAHTLDGKGCMALQVVAFLHELGFTHAGDSYLYLRMIAPDLHPLTRFPDGSEIKDHVITIRSPYQCAADEYDRKFQPPRL